MSALDYGKHETSACVLVPGTEESEYFGRFYNSMDEDRTIAAADLKNYGVYGGNRSRYGYRLAFITE